MGMKKKKKKLKTKQIIFIVLSIVILLLIIFSITLKTTKKQNKVESLIKDSVIGVEKILFYPFRTVYNVFYEYKELKSIKKKYDTLKLSVDRIDSLNTENIELRKEIESLKKELHIDTVLSEYEYLNATVVARNIGYWYNTITLDKGSYNGVTEDMVVVNSYGLIGKVTSVTTFTSDVRLLTTNDSNNKISVLVSSEDNNYYGVINGYDYNNRTLTVEGISNTEKIVKDSYVYTSGLGGVFPRGILIGKVESETTDEYDLAKIIKVKPLADFDDINYVAILKRKSN